MNIVPVVEVLWRKSKMAIECPECGGTDLLAGPRGGLAQNVKCDRCGTIFSVVPGWPGGIGEVMGRGQIPS